MNCGRHTKEKQKMLTSTAKLFVGITLAVASGGAAAAWTGLHEDSSDYQAFVEPASVKSNGVMVSLSMLYSMLEPDTNPSGIKYSSFVVQKEFDCSKNQKRNLSFAFYASKNGQGTPVDTKGPPPQWEVIAADSPFAPELKYACGRK